jgi:multiple antibiotic resistance protein
MSFSQYFILTFIPLFIVVDSLGNLPFIVTLTEGSSAKERYRIIHIASITATSLGLIFLFFGAFILNVLGITLGAFSIAGGVIILALSVKYMTTGRMVHMIKEEMIAVVPIGTPLVVGPASITTLLILSQEYPIYVVLLSFLANMIVSWMIFLLSMQITRFLGLGGLRAISKVFSLLLAAIAVSMIIHGLTLYNLISTA